MNPLLKLLLAALALVVILVVAAVLVVALVVDPNAYRGQIEAAVQRQTGRQLSIAGDLSLELLPCCGIGVGRSSLSNPPGFDGEQFAGIEQARLGLQLWPLLTRQELLIGQVSLQGLDLRLIRRADGRANWEFDTESQPPPAAPETPAADGSEGLRLSVAGIDIDDARVAYRDESAGLDYLVEELDLQTGAIEAGQPFDLSAAFRVTDRVAGDSATLSLRADASVDTEAMSGRLRELRGELSASGPTLDGGELQADLSAGEVRLDAAEDIRAELAPVNATVELRGGAAPAGGVKARLDVAQVGWSEAGTRLSGMNADLTAAGAALQLSGDGTLGGDQAMNGRFSLGPLSPRELLQKLELPVPVTADPDVLRQLSATGRWRVAADSYELPELSMTLDDTRITGSAGVSEPARPRIRFALSGDRLDLDRYLAPETEGGAAAGEADEPAGEEASMEPLRELNLDGRLGLDELLVGGLRLQALSAEVRARDGVITLAPLEAQLYDGSYAGSLRLDVTGAEPRLELDQDLSAVQVSGLLADLAEVTQLQGLLAADLDLAGQLGSQRDLVQSLTGGYSISLADGVYQGMDIWYEIRRAKARIEGEPAPPREGPAETRIRNLQLGGQLADGVLRSERLTGEIPFLRLTGDGSLDLRSQALDYRLRARVFETPTFADGETLDELTDLVIPLTIGGTVEQPKIGVELQELLKGLAGRRLREELLEELGLDKEREQQAPQEGDTADQAAPTEEPKEPESPEDILKRRLRELLEP